MDLLDRYLAAVGALLPKAQREDIVAELRDLLLDRIEAREGQLGRPLTAAEREEVLKAFGHPIAVAGRYGARQALIGPELYPYWLFAVKGLLAVAAVATAIPAVVAAISHPGDLAGAFTGFLSNLLSLGLMMVGAVTAVGVAIERGWIQLDLGKDWKIGDLPRLEVERSVNKRLEALFGAAVGVIFVLWWTGTVPAPWSTALRGEAVLEAAPIWSRLYLPILILALAQVGSGLLGAARPDWVRARAAVEMGCAIGGLWLVSMLWSAGRLVEARAITGPGAGTMDVERLQVVLDATPRISMMVVVVIGLITLAIQGWRLVRGGPSRVAAKA